MARLICDKKRKTSKWCVTYTEHGKRKRKHFEFQDNARDFCKAQQYKEERIDNDLTHVEDMSFEDAIQKYTENYLITKTKSYQDSEAWRFHLLRKYFGNLYLSDITKQVVENHKITRLKEGISHKTINNELTLLSSLFNWAMSTEPVLAKENPVKSVKRLDSLPVQTRRAMEEGEIETLLTNACSCCLPSYVIMLNTGIRWGELNQLNKADFDLKRHVLVLKHSEGMRLKGKRNRTVPLNDTVEQVVSQLPDGPIYTLGYSSMRDHLRALCKRTGLKTCIHNLRHTYITNQLENGVPAAHVQRNVGHIDLATTLKYTHLSDSVNQKYRNTVQFKSSVLVANRCNREGKMGVDRDESVQNVQKKSYTNQQVSDIVQDFSMLPRGFEPSAKTQNNHKNQLVIDTLWQNIARTHSDEKQDMASDEEWVVKYVGLDVVVLSSKDGTREQIRTRVKEEE